MLPSQTFSNSQSELQKNVGSFPVLLAAAHLFNAECIICNLKIDCYDYYYQ